MTLRKIWRWILIRVFGPPTYEDTHLDMDFIGEDEEFH